jgi:hypothetical protein
VSSVIKITGIGDHDQPDWLIRMTGIRILVVQQDPRPLDAACRLCP